MEPQNGQIIIDNFNQDTGFTTDLSTTAQLALANKWYRKVLSDRDWEFLKKSATGTITVTNGVATIAQPSDFKQFSINGQATDIAVGVGSSYGYGSQAGPSPIGNASPRVIFVAVNTGVYQPYQIINFSARNMYANKNGYCYLDVVNKVITFTVTPTGSDLSYSFDYIYMPPSLTLTTTPVFPADYHDIIHHGMATDDVIFQIFDSSRSYAKENAAQYKDYLASLQLYNAQLQMD